MQQWGRMMLSCFLLMIGFYFLQAHSSARVVPLRHPLDQFPIVVGEWKAEGATIFGDDVLSVLQLSDYIARRYVDASGRGLFLYIGYWESQGTGAVPHSPRLCLPGAGWEPIDFQQIEISVEDTTLQANRYLLQKDKSQQLVMYWYYSQGQSVANDFATRWLTVKNAVLRKRTDGALIRISSPVYGSVSETVDYQVKYIQAMYPILRQVLPE